MLGVIAIICVLDKIMWHFMLLDGRSIRDCRNLRNMEGFDYGLDSVKTNDGEFGLYFLLLDGRSIRV